MRGWYNEYRTFCVSVPLPQNFRVAAFIAVSATFITAVIIAFMFGSLANNSKIEL